jgi:hypothetical protein
MALDLHLGTGGRIREAFAQRAVILALALGCIFSSLRMHATPGQILGAEVQTNGWTLFVWVEGMAVGGAYQLGWGTNNVLDSSNRLVLTLASPGFDDECRPISVSRTLYGTKQLRTPGQTYWGELPSATGVLLKFALSDYIFAGDSNLVLSIQPGLYSTTNGLKSGGGILAVTNSSLAKWPKVLATWSDVPYRRLTDDNYALRCVAFHRSAQKARPVRAVRFWSVDQHGNTNTPVTVLSPTVDSGWGDESAVTEYVAMMDGSRFHSGDRITSYFAAYPWEGDLSSVSDCSDGSWGEEAMQAGPFVMLYDRQSSSVFAVVDPAAAAGSGRVTLDPAEVASGTVASFGSISAALDAVALTNSARFGRRDWGNATLFLTSGSHTWGGGSVSAISNMVTWVTLAPHPSANKAGVVLKNSNASGRNYYPGKVCFSGVTVDWTNSTPFLYGMSGVWFDQCNIRSNLASSAVLANCCTNIWVTRCTVDQQRSTFRMGSDPAQSHWFLRGNRFTGSVGFQAHVLLGNLGLPDAKSEIGIQNENGANGIDPCFVAFNRFYRSANVDSIIFGKTSPIRQGLAFVQNLVEVSASPYGMGIGSISTGSNTNVSPTRNILCWHNTMVGQRWLDQYNDADSFEIHSDFCSLRNNVFDDYNTKHDRFSPPNASRTNRWSVMYQVGASGNVMAELISGDFSPESSPDQQGNGAFNGISSHHCATNRPDLYYRWRSPQSWAGASLGERPGYGDYHPVSGSPVLNRVWEPVLPFDLDGLPRSTRGAAGVFEGPRMEPSRLRVVSPPS